MNFVFQNYLIEYILMFWMNTYNINAEIKLCLAKIYNAPDFVIASQRTFWTARASSQFNYHMSPI